MMPRIATRFSQIKTKTNRRVLFSFRTTLKFFHEAFSKNGNLARPIALFLIFALLSPVMFLGGFGRVSAQSNSSSRSSTAPVSAPPLPYRFESSVQSLGFGVQRFGKYLSSVSEYIAAPTLPEGFEAAEAVSPLYADVSAFVGSVGSTFAGSVLGVVVPGSLTENSLTEDSGFPYKLEFK